MVSLNKPSYYRAIGIRPALFKLFKKFGKTLTGGVYNES